MDIEIVKHTDGTSTMTCKTHGQTATMGVVMTEALGKLKGKDQSNRVCSYIGMAHSPATMFRMTAKRKGIVAA